MFSVPPFVSAPVFAASIFPQIDHIRPPTLFCPLVACFLRVEGASRVVPHGQSRRPNGAFCHGPVTEIGKMRSADSGSQDEKLPDDPSIARPQSPQRPPAPGWFPSRTLALNNEDAAKLQVLTDGYLARFRPAGARSASGPCVPQLRCPNCRRGTVTAAQGDGMKCRPCPPAFGIISDTLCPARSRFALRLCSG